MKEDIKIPEDKNVQLAVAMAADDDWSIYMLNKSEELLEDPLVVSKGYGKKDGEDIKTSTLRHKLNSIAPGEWTAIERIDPALFTLTHEFWVTYFIDGRIHDKKFIFPAGTISKKNLSYIEELEKQGVLKT